MIPLFRLTHGQPGFHKTFDCGLMVEVRSDSGQLLLLSSDNDPTHVQQHLPKLKGQPIEPLASRRWALWRQDDNGNDFFMMAFATHQGAHCTAQLFESRGHKQSYWVEEKD